MSSDFIIRKNTNLQFSAAYECFLNEEYSKAISLYEQAIEIAPQDKSNYWYLGLVWLLQGQEEDAHTTWLCGMVDGDSEQVEQWTAELVQVLDAEAQRRETLQENSLALLIRGHIRELYPTEINNLLHLVELAIGLESLSAEDLTEWGVIPLLQENEDGKINKDLLFTTLQKLLDFAPLHPLTIEFANACVAHLATTAGFLNVLLVAAIKISYSMQSPAIGVELAKLCLKVDENYPEFWGHLASFYLRARNYSQGIEAAKRCYSLMESLPDKIFGSYTLMRGLMGAGGYWQEVNAALQEQEEQLLSLIENPPTEVDKVTASRLLIAAFFFPYLRDMPVQNRFVYNQMGRLCQFYIQSYSRKKEVSFTHSIERKSLAAGKPLKIGYISHCLNSHSVGWLARWIFLYHNREQFNIYGYFLTYREPDQLQEWYANQVDFARKVNEIDSLKIAQQIAEDEIDILVDLDSLTLDTTCEVMALKPAPVQVTWLGWDASGLPAIDYYIADSYVLPKNAQDYYTEKIWRLPQSYIAVNGFEVGVPTLRREDLNIPSDAVVYFSGQTGYKRHRETVRLQMKIIKEVPNSYFLIKGQAEEESIKNFFTEIAQEESVSPERLRFLPLVASEEIHRANLGLADVVLDTYPYNGATTTLETLWMGIPLVTRVGEQFAARNSYTMMMNVGVTEGIAWTDDEYVEWGIRLGKDKELRQNISWKLWQSRKTSPLWNGKQFTQEMEKAYEQMWQRYLNGES